MQMDRAIHLTLVVILVFIVTYVLYEKMLYDKRTIKDFKIEIDNSGSILEEVKMEHCKCSRVIETKPNHHLTPSQQIPYEATTCSRDSFLRGANQKIVGFSFYGPKDSGARRYLEGIEENLDLLATYYPGWVMRVYLDGHPKLMEHVCNLACKNPLLDICDVNHLPGTPMVNATDVYAMIWRFFPTLDPQVEIFASRDLDSRFSAREAAAVNEWLYNSTEPIHAMRDHPQHIMHLMGGSWGTYLSRKDVRIKWKRAWKHIFEDKETYTPRTFKDSGDGPDQNVIDRYVWQTFGHKMAIQHDSYLCESYGGIPWPTKRLEGPDNFAFSAVGVSWKLTKKCPENCRPKNHKDWEYC